MEDLVNEKPLNEAGIKQSFEEKIASEITTKRILVGVGATIGLAVLLPVAFMAAQTGMYLAVVGGFVLIGGVVYKKLPGWQFRLENSIREENQKEMNRHLAALKDEAKKNPIEQLQNYLKQKADQLQSYKKFVTEIGTQVKNTKDLLNERKKNKPDKDYSKKDEAIKAMEKAYKFHLEMAEKGSVALENLKEAIDDAKFDFNFGKAGQAAMQNMKALQGADLINEMLADESFESVRNTFNSVFSEIEVQIGSINNTEKLTSGEEDIFLDISKVHIPMEKDYVGK